MAETQQDPDVYRLQYEASRALFDVDLQGCISAAKHSLVDPTLPPYWFIKNCILVACALENWRDADIFRTTAEAVYHETLAEVTGEDDDGSLELLKDVAEELESLEQFREEEMFELTGISIVHAWDDEEINDIGVYQESFGAMDGEMDAFPYGYSEFSEDYVQHNSLDGATGDGAAENFELPVHTKDPRAITKAAEAPSLICEREEAGAVNDCEHTPPQEALC
ncbi:hypothetical protein C7974DRAFT_445962 [Boeremia exigua]|uniref:uncharacterized protein n=1 Tax=Boeremia exigua TaxID=749465 RepID=UPI001E8CD435|nr:uncharacterized protein C7974DRAFT_445962 [Boeremia exigua]KAH6612081.1 hypothetical protein C7974DRAFT_445962 [Boeremia exigua]